MNSFDRGSLKSFFEMIAGQSLSCSGIGQALAIRLDVPYLEDRSGERMLGHRLKEVPEAEAIEKGLLLTRQFRFASGEILCTDEWPERLFKEENMQLTEEVWTKDNWPDSYNSVGDAVAKLPNGITGIYYHKPSMNLILVGPHGEKVGIRSTALVVMGITRTGNCRPFDQLTKFVPS